VRDPSDNISTAETTQKDRVMEGNFSPATVFTVAEVVAAKLLQADGRADGVRWGLESRENRGGHTAAVPAMEDDGSVECTRNPSTEAALRLPNLLKTNEEE
jgi:hypothetical protein